MRYKIVFNGIRIAIIRWRLRQLKAERDQAVADIIFAVDYRLYAQREFIERGNCITARQELLEKKLQQITNDLEGKLA